MSEHARPTLAEFERDVSSRVQAILDAGGEPPLADHRLDVEGDHARGVTPGTAALDAVGFLRQERFGSRTFCTRAAFDPQEQRVVEYLTRGGGIGAGMDPVGFLIASHDYATSLLRTGDTRIAQLEAQLRAAGIGPELSPEQEDALDEKAAAAYGQALHGVFGVAPERAEDASGARARILLVVDVPEGMPISAEEIMACEDRVHASVRRADADLVGRVALSYRMAA